MEKILGRYGGVALTSGVWAFGIGPPRVVAQSQTKTETACCGAKKKSVAAKKATAKFASRAETLLGTMPTNKGEWGLLIVDAETGEPLYYQKSAKNFVRPS